MKTKQKLSFKDAAQKILKNSDQPLSAKEITEIAIEDGLISTEGKTPEATMAAQLYLDIKTGDKSKFKKIGKGKFSLKEQTESASSPLLLIENQNSLVKNSLMKKLLDMDSYQFEFLIADLLKNIGYENVEVTKRSGDKGVDINANLTMDGITNVKTVIQVKKYKQANKISNDVIMQLRGSAEVDQRGLVITTSDYTAAAIQEAKASNKMPVSLINGPKLISLLLKYGVGVKKENVEIFSIDNDYFQSDSEIERKIFETGKNKGIWPLPGGINSYVDSLLKFLSAINKGVNTRPKLFKWIKDNFENCNSEKTAKGYGDVPKNMGLSFFDNGIIKLTKEGKDFLKNKDYDFLYKTISHNIIAFDEIVEFIKSSDEPQTEQNILEYCNENFDINWTTFAQVNFRLLWLINIGKIKKTEDGYLAI